MNRRFSRGPLLLAAAFLFLVPWRFVRGDGPPLSEAELKKKEEKLREDVRNLLERLKELEDVSRDLKKAISELAGLPLPGTGTSVGTPVVPAPQVPGSTTLSDREKFVFDASPVVGSRGFTPTTGLSVKMTQPQGTRDTKLSVTIPTGLWSGSGAYSNGYYGPIGSAEVSPNTSALDAEKRTRSEAVERQIAAAYELGGLREPPGMRERGVGASTQRLAMADTLSRSSYGAGLLSETGHSAISAQLVAAYGDAGPRYFAVRGGPGSYSPFDSSYAFADGTNKAGDAKKDSLVVISGKTKLSVVASSASNERFREMAVGREHSLHKGFNFDAVAVDHQLVLGDFIGHFAAEYFDDPSGNDDRLELINASGKIGFRRRSEDVRDVVTLAIGSMSLPVGLYNDNEWDYWAWGARPFIYGRLFNGNLIGEGVMGLARFDPRDANGFQDTSTDLVFRAGAFNGQGAKMQGFIGGDSVGGFSLDGKERYSLTDLVYFGDLLGSMDLRRCHCDPLIVSGGAFGIYGPNGTGDDGETLFYGLRARALWLARRPAPSLTPLEQVSDGFLIEGEWAKREYHVDGNATTIAQDLEDWGLWVSAVYTLRSPFEWSCGALSFGARYDSGSGRGDSNGKSRHDDVMRDDRTRWSALVAWDPGCANEILKHFTFSLEYQYDESDSFRSGEETIVLGFQIR